MINRLLNSLISQRLIEITRELDKESLIYFYTIYYYYKFYSKLHISFMSSIKGNSYLLELSANSTKDRLEQKIELEDKLEVVLQLKDLRVDQ